VVFNDALAARQAAHAAGEPYITDAQMSARLTESKSAPGREWLGGVSSVVLQQALADLNTAYRNFFNSVTRKRKGPRSRRPVSGREGPAAGHPVHRQRSVPGPRQRKAAAPEDR
jgi:putative transposase